LINANQIEFLVCRIIQVVVCHQLSYLLNNRILYYSMWYPYHVILSHLHL